MTLLATGPLTQECQMATEICTSWLTCGHQSAGMRASWQGPLVSQCSVSRKTRQLLWRENCSASTHTHIRMRTSEALGPGENTSLSLSPVFLQRWVVASTSFVAVGKGCLVLGARAKRSAFSHCRQQHSVLIYLLSVSLHANSSHPSSRRPLMKHVCS